MLICLCQFTSQQILRAKEVCIPEDTQSDSDSDSDKSEQSVDCSHKSDARRGQSNRGGSLADIESEYNRECSGVDSGSDSRFDSLPLTKSRGEKICSEKIGRHKKKTENIPWMKGRRNNVLLE